MTREIVGDVVGVGEGVGLVFAVDDCVGLREGVSASPKLEDKLLQPVPFEHKGFEQRADVIDGDAV